MSEEATHRTRRFTWMSKRLTEPERLPPAARIEPAVWEDASAMLAHEFRAKSVQRS